MKGHIIIVVIAGVLALAAFACLVGCSESDTGDGPDAGNASTHTVTFEAAGITGQTGKVLVAAVHTGISSQPLGVLCVQLQADPASVSGMAMVLQDMATEPCALTTEAAQLAAGDYTVSASIFTAGMMTPDACAADVDITIDDADAVVTLGAFGACD